MAFIRKSNVLAALPKPIQTLIPGDGEQPGLERPGFHQAVPVLVNTQERLLHHILSCLRVMHHLVTESIHWTLVAIVQTDECEFVA